MTEESKAAAAIYRVAEYLRNGDMVRALEPVEGGDTMYVAKLQTVLDAGLPTQATAATDKPIDGAGSIDEAFAIFDEMKAAFVSQVRSEWTRKKLLAGTRAAMAPGMGPQGIAH